MNDNELIHLERTLLCSMLFCDARYEKEEVYWEVERGADLELFSGQRRKIAEFINQNLNKGYEAIWVLLEAKTKAAPQSAEQKAFTEEVCEVLGAPQVVHVNTFRAVANEIKAVRAAKAAFKKLRS